MSIHRAIAHHAYDLLNDETRTQVNALVDVFVEEHADTFQDNWDRQRQFGEMAAWLDSLQGELNEPRPYASWHFITQSYDIRKNKTTAMNLKGDFNILDGLVLAQKKLRDASDPQQQALYLAIFAHLVGDAHQPLHAVTLFSDEFPKGNQGGNLLEVYVDGQSTKLHALWDRAGYVTYKNLHSAMTTFYQMPIVCFDNTAKQSAADWVTEGYDLGVESAYYDQQQLIVIDAVLSPAYIEQAKQIAIQRTNQASCRLAFLLNKIFN